MAKLCLKCNQLIPSWIKIDNKRRNLKNRKYCVSCSPFNTHNTKQLHCEVLPGKKFSKKYCDMSAEEKAEYNKKTYNYQRKKRWNLKKELVTILGGSCSSCGYNTNLAALSFHHIDPSNKSFELDSRALISKSKETILAEVNKCQLLCMNCHQTLHHPQLSYWK